MTTEKRLLGASSVTGAFSITLIKNVRNYLNIKEDDLIGFYENKEKKILIVSDELTENLKLLGSSTVTTTNTVTLPKKVREQLKINVGNQVAYYRESEGKIELKAT